ncbi:MAG: hypothetical protein H6Q20_2071 [Bacteroidetes bacterium]|nr:hypothetical protein [Bacteroidota bacterium]
MYISIIDYFKEYYRELPKESMTIFETISKIYEIKNVDDYKNIYDFLWIDFNYHRVLIKYDELAKMTLPFDDDIIKFIAFLYGTSYFIRIGYPDLDVWLNAKDINHPFEKNIDINEGFSLIEAVKYEYGQNAVRAMLLSTLKWIGPQGG